LLDLNLRGIRDEREVAAVSLALADIVKVNEGELACLLGWLTPARCADEAGSPPAMAALMHRFDLDRLVLTRGGDGWSCYGRDGEVLLCGHAPPVAVRDTVGAGDAFSAVMLVGEARAWPLATTLRRAAAFASQACTLRGAFDAASPIYAETRAAWQAEDERVAD
jgi:fructokinase